jgi:hypothetical protein
LSGGEACNAMSDGRVAHDHLSFQPDRENALVAV